MQLVFDARKRFINEQQCVNVSFVGDERVENTENFYALLSTDDDDVVALSPDIAEILIMDNDRELIY